MNGCPFLHTDGCIHGKLCLCLDDNKWKELAFKTKITNRMISATEFFLAKVKTDDETYTSTQVIEALEAYEIHLITTWQERIDKLAKYGK